MKTEFDLVGYTTLVGTITISCDLVNEIIVEMEPGNLIGRLKGKDLERFAVNILKALKSKKLK